MSEQDSESDTTADDTEAPEPTQTSQTHNVLNNTMHDEDESIYDEDESSEEEHVNEIQPYKENGEQNNVQENKLLTANFEVKVENREVEGLTTYSTDQQKFKFYINSGTNKEVWGVYIDFQSIHSKWTIDVILQHTGFYATTDDPNVMMRENHDTKSSEYIIIYEDELYIVSTTSEEIFHMLKIKYKITTYLQDKYQHDPGGRDICQCQIKQYLENLYANVDMLFNNKLPADLHISFEIIKLLINKGNLNLIYNKNTYQHFNHSSIKRTLDELYNKV